jgi:hypothetical protein
VNILAFKPDIYEQAGDEVDNKSMGDQIAHSRMFHFARSAFSSSGSRASKGASVLLGIGKMALSAIPIPVVGSIAAAIADKVNGKVRGARLASNLAKATTSEEKAKFMIKDLTVENLDRYRWKLKDSYEELNTAITAFNKSEQGCDDFYYFALAYKQVERRRIKLDDELLKFQAVIEEVDAWKKSVEKIQGLDVTIARNRINSRKTEELKRIRGFNKDNPADQPMIALVKIDHEHCENWCCIKQYAKYNPHTDWEVIKRNASNVVSFLVPVALDSVPTE